MDLPPPRVDSTGAHTPPAAAQEIHLSEYWAVVVKRRRLILVCIALALLIGAVTSIISRPTYKATTALDIEKDKGSVLDIGNVPQPYVTYDPEFLPTQTRLMRSREVAERVVQRMNLASDPEINPPRKGMFALGGGDVSKASKDVIARTASALQSNINVVPIRGTNMVELSYVASSPKQAADIANAIADAYIDWNLESKFQVISQASQFLNGQIEQLKSEIDTKERQLQAYSRQKDIVSVDPQSNVTLQKLESLNRDYANAVSDRVTKEARYHEVSTARPDTITDTLSSGFVAQLRNDQAKLEREYAEKLNLFKPEWPAMQQLKAQLDKGRQHLDSVIQETVAKARDMARSDYLTALRREESLKAVLQGQKSEAMVLNTNAVEYNNIKLEVETKRALYDTLLRRNAETQVASRLRGERLSNVRVVDRALPPGSRFKPSYKQNGILSLFLGAAIGIGLAFLLEYLDRSLRTSEQVERLLQLPALGIIPAANNARRRFGDPYRHAYRPQLRKKTNGDGEPKMAIELLPHEHPHSPIAEAYRAFRTALLLSRAGGVKTIAITSSLPTEGKTITALNLAVVLGQLGKRVAVVDADLHKSRMHEILRISNRVGLVSILAENIGPTDALQKTSVPNVFLIPSGPSSPNPSGLLSSEAMRKFLQFMAMNFDYVILDTPPISLVADALLLGNEVDGVVLTVRGGRTAHEQVQRVRDKLLRSGAKILGALINNLDEEAPGYSRYYAYYSKGYAQEKPYRETPRAAATR